MGREKAQGFMGKASLNPEPGELLCGGDQDDWHDKVSGTADAGLKGTTVQ